MNLDWMIALPPILLALLAGLFTWGVTALGASLIFFFKNINRKVLDAMLGFAAGIMIAASIWSLLLPAIGQVEESGAFWQVIFGFLAGGVFLWGLDKVIPHMHLFGKKAEGVKTSWHRSILLVSAITLHNIPEGLAVGVAFGALAINPSPAVFAAAVGLAIGIGLQNFPEGTAVSAPLYREGMSRGKAFMYGQFSGAVEPVAAVIGALLVSQMSAILPFALAFAAGAMIFVVVEELIPESQAAENTDMATLMTMVGFVVMMSMDVLLG
ncbi:ZIP family metal transporter [Culicoidibacter larvae]|uniref:ZIP family metal transporter n=1 Tax=Culicoidibacter larvae TaxID=2579976 RepID=A0A5R8QH93_9FIRM|nr:ZIP family metal transporter [Culicoidibacter larvae]TLG76637.1 ZIP family metal transporter [Culicoidibacter larvae]